MADTALMADDEATYVPIRPVSDWPSGSAGPVWGEYMAMLDEARDSAEPEVLTRAIDVALRSAALETGAIEGLYPTTRGVTRTVALQGALWEAELEKLGPDVRGHFDAQLAAFNLVLDAATTAQPISEAWLRALHECVTGAQPTYKAYTELGLQELPLPRGQYKEMPNHVTLVDGTIRYYAPVSDTSVEMNRLIQELRSEQFQRAHPVLQAAYSHHALVSIHPFADGNGRVSRALASVFLYRATGVPLIVFSDQQERYWDGLAAADHGDYQAFVRFVEDRALDGMALVTDRLREARRPLEEKFAGIRRLLTAHGGLMHSEVQALGQRLH